MLYSNSDFKLVDGQLLCLLVIHNQGTIAVIQVYILHVFIDPSIYFPYVLRKVNKLSNISNMLSVSIMLMFRLNLCDKENRDMPWGGQLHHY